MKLPVLLVLLLALARSSGLRCQTSWKNEDGFNEFSENHILALDVKGNSSVNNANSVFKRYLQRYGLCGRADLQTFFRWSDIDSVENICTDEGFAYSDSNGNLCISEQQFTVYLVASEKRRGSCKIHNIDIKTLYVVVGCGKIKNYCLPVHFEKHTHVPPNLGGPRFLILLNLSAAFDTVNHKILLSVLTDLGITGTAWKWFESYLEDRHYQLTTLSSIPARLSCCLSPALQVLTVNSLITPTEDARSLGVILDGQLSFSAHIAKLTRSCRFLLYSIRRIRSFLSQEATQLLVQSLVISRLDYCNSLLAGLPLRAIRPLQLIQNAAVRLIFNLPKFTHVTPLLRSLHWLPVIAHIRFKTRRPTKPRMDQSLPTLWQWNEHQAGVASSLEYGIMPLYTSLIKLGFLYAEQSDGGMGVSF
ncbi:hypothetical protein NFI96_002572 [Prochilodus magdalenae]|nr:hypothetical protein NFI96_002572 [Prochilodus magdalenae]